jgi:hypothetical protein
MGDSFYHAVQTIPQELRGALHRVCSFDPLSLLGARIARINRAASRLIRRMFAPEGRPCE